MKRIPILIPFCLFLASCATLDENQCKTVNWHELGIRDGSNGKPVSRIEEHTDACKDYGIRPDRNAYLSGRDLGLRQYCVFDNAVREGLAGRSYQHVCPPAISRQFADLHGAAYAVHTARENLDSLNRRADSLERERRSEKTSNERKKHIREELRTLDRQLERARDEIRSREHELDRENRRIAR